MQLRHSPTSPYVRKVLVLAAETRLGELLEKIPTDPHDGDTDLGDSNPLGKVPTLVTDEGLVLFDSPLICEYLDNYHGGQRMVPVATPARWQVLRMQAAGDGIMDAAVAAVMEGRRPDGERSERFVARQRGVILRTCRWLEDNLDQLVAGSVNLGQIAVACALGYLDFRMPELGWRDDCQGLAERYAGFAQRDSMRATAPD